MSEVLRSILIVYNVHPDIQCDDMFNIIEPYGSIKSIHCYNTLSELHTMVLRLRHEDDGFRVLFHLQGMYLYGIQLRMECIGGNSNVAMEKLLDIRLNQVAPSNCFEMYYTGTMN